MNSDAGDCILSLLMLGGMFFVGKKTGERQTIQRYEDEKRNNEIHLLKMEIEQLKNKSITNQ